MDTAGDPDLAHLTRQAQLIAVKDDAERIAAITREQFIPYKRSVKVLDELERLYRREDAIRAQGRLFIGPSLSGKSSILRKFAQSHRADDNVEGEAALVPVLWVQYPEKASEGIYSAICQALNHRPPVSASLSRMRADCLDLLKSVEVRVLLIDEFHNVLHGNVEEQRVGLATIKYVMNSLGRPVVVAGTSGAYNAVSKDTQMLSRLRPIYLNRFHEDDEEFISLLAGFQMSMPLRKPSNLLADELQKEIFRLTDGLVGHIADLISELGRIAVESGEECITLATVKECHWVPMADKDEAFKAV